MYGAPNIGNIDWTNEEQQRNAKTFFHCIVHEWNRTQDIHQ
jgi:hypothetical protein